MHKYRFAVLAGVEIAEDVMPKGLRGLDTIARMYRDYFHQHYFDFASCDHCTRHGYI